MHKLYIIPILLYMGLISMPHDESLFLPGEPVLAEAGTGIVDFSEDLVDFHANGVKQVSAKFKKNKLSGA